MMSREKLRSRLARRNKRLVKNKQQFKVVFRLFRSTTLLSKLAMYNHRFRKQSRMLRRLSLSLSFSSK